MIRVFTDFNARTEDGVCWNLKFQNRNLEDLANDLHLKVGDKITLYQDEDDFDVVATLDFRQVGTLGRETWVAIPDWNTITRKVAAP